MIKRIDPHKASSSTKMSDAVEQILKRMEQVGITVPRSQPKNLQGLRDHIAVILSNLAGGGWISFHLANGSYRLDRTRKGFQFTSTHLRKVVLFLEKDGLIEIDRGFNYPGSPGEASRMKATSKLKEILNGVEVETDSAGMPLVVVRGVKDKDGKRKVCKLPVPRAMEENVRLINDVIQNARIESPGRRVDLTRRHVYRSFLDRRFDRGGRFFGGFWEIMPKEDRRKLLINDMPVWEFDYGAFHPSILYGMKGVEPPPDVYTVANYGPEYRGLIKTFVLRMTNTGRIADAIRSMQDHPPREKHIPDGFDLNDWPAMRKLADAIKAHNQPIAEYLDGPKGISAELQWHDSEIMERVLVHFAVRGIPALPVHDSLIVPLDHSRECIAAMRAAFKERFNQDIRVDGTLLGGLLDAIDRAPRTPQLVELAGEVAYQLAEWIAFGNPSDSAEGKLSQQVMSMLKNNPP